MDPYRYNLTFYSRNLAFYFVVVVSRSRARINPCLEFLLMPR